MLSRKNLLFSSMALAAAAVAESAKPVFGQTPSGTTPEPKLVPVELAPGIFSLTAPLGYAWCNATWVVFRDYTLLLDGGTRFEAQHLEKVIGTTTTRPIKLVLNTHHHGDHSYGNEYWVSRGATIMGNTNIVAEYKRVEPKRLENFPAQRAKAAFAAELAVTHLHPPSVLLPAHTAFDDGNQRVELLSYGPAHTNADTMAWLPKHKILAPGDVVVNGQFNVMWDAHVLSWMKVLEQTRLLGAKTVVPGHGPNGPGSIVDDQLAYFTAIHNAVRNIIASGGTADSVRAAVPSVRKRLLADRQIARYTILNDDFLPDLVSLSGQMGRFYTALTGRNYLVAGSLEEQYRAEITNMCCSALHISA
jgi:cyclase